MKRFLRRIGPNPIRGLAFGILVTGSLAAGAAVPAHAAFIPPSDVTRAPTISAYCRALDQGAYGVVVDGQYFTPGAAVTITVTDPKTGLSLATDTVPAAADGTIHDSPFNLLASGDVTATDGISGASSNTVSASC